MRVGMDFSTAILQNRAGIGNYAFNLVNAIARVDRENEYLLYPFFYRKLLGFDLKAPLPASPRVRMAWRSFPWFFAFLLWARFIPERFKEFALGDVDIVHSLAFTAPRLRSGKRRLVVTVHDLTFITHPECHKDENREHCTRSVKEAVKHADAIIAVSEHTKADLVRYLGAPEELIHVTHLAAGPEYHEVNDPEVLDSIRKKYGLPPNYILFVGSIEPRKNLKTLLKAYSVLPEGMKKEFPLVIAGGKGWLNSDIPAKVKEYGIEERVRFVGYIDGSDIAPVYSGAEVFAYPSLYEGFGLPILEAMSCGVPVITSNTSSMPEVAGGAARLVNPMDAHGLSEALKDILGDSLLRKTMREKGLQRAACFSWDKCARETIGVYEKVMGSRKRA